MAPSHLCVRLGAWAPARECLRDGVCVRASAGGSPELRRSAPGGTAGVAALRAQLAEAGLGPQPSPPPLQRPARAAAVLRGQRAGGQARWRLRAERGTRGVERGEAGRGAQTRGGKQGSGGRSGGSWRRPPPLPLAVAVGHPPRAWGSWVFRVGSGKSTPTPFSYARGGALKTVQEVVYRLPPPPSPNIIFLSMRYS